MELVLATVGPTVFFSLVQRKSNCEQIKLPNGSERGELQAIVNFSHSIYARNLCVLLVPQILLITEIRKAQIPLSWGFGLPPSEIRFS